MVGIVFAKEPTVITAYAKIDVAQSEVRII
jgi:hypothetical protein